MYDLRLFLYMKRKRKAQHCIAIHWMTNLDDAVEFLSVEEILVSGNFDAKDEIRLTQYLNSSILTNVTETFTVDLLSVQRNTYSFLRQSNYKCVDVVVVCCRYCRLL